MKKYYVQPINETGNQIINDWFEEMAESPSSYECFQGKSLKIQSPLPIREIPRSLALSIYKSKHEGIFVYFMERINKGTGDLNFRRIKGKKLFPKGKVIKKKESDDKEVKKIKDKLEELKDKKIKK